MKSQSGEELWRLYVSAMGHLIQQVNPFSVVRLETTEPLPQSRVRGALTVSTITVRVDLCMLAFLLLVVNSPATQVRYATMIRRSLLTTFGDQPKNGLMPVVVNPYEAWTLDSAALRVMKGYLLDDITAIGCVQVRGTRAMTA
jgi:hypothetical protein